MSLQKPIVGVSEAVILLFFFISVKVMLSQMLFTYEVGMNAAWVIPLMLMLIGLFGVLLLVNLLNRFPGRDLVQVGEELVGPYVNALFALFYLTVFVVGAGSTLRGISERMVVGYLPDSPISLITFSFIAATMIVSYLGLEAVARTARFLASLLLLTMLALVALTIPFWNFNALYPLLGPGPLQLLMGALENTGDFTQILLLGIIYPFLSAGQGKKVGVWAVVLSGFFMFLYTLAPILIFTYPTVSELSVPSFEMTRIINIGRFGQRLEILFLPIWSLGNMILLSASLYAGAAVLTRIFKLSDYRPFILSMGVFVSVVAFIPQNVTQAAYWHYEYVIRYSFFILAGILVILQLVAARKRKARGGGQNA